MTKAGEGAGYLRPAPSLVRWAAKSRIRNHAILSHPVQAREPVSMWRRRDARDCREHRLLP